MKLRYMVIFLFIGLALFGMLAVKQKLKQETQRLREENEYQGLSMSGTVLLDVERINLISAKGILSSEITEKDVFNLEAFVEQGGASTISEYLEAYYLVRTALNEQCMFYEIMDVEKTVEEVSGAPGTYVEIIFQNPHTFRFAQQRDWIMEETRHLLFNAEDGTLWYGTDPGSFSYCAIYSNEENSYRKDSDFISLVEGEYSW